MYTVYARGRSKQLNTYWKQAKDYEERKIREALKDAETEKSERWKCAER